MSGWIRTVPGPVRLIHLLAGDLLDLFFPAPCLACGNPGVSGPICSSCRRTLERRRTSSAVRAIEGLPVVTPFEYAFPLNRLIPRAKRRGWPRHLAVLVAPMISALRTAGLSDWPQVVAPVPLHPTRRRERGWDQAVYLAGKVAECLELPCSPAALRRSRATPPQKSAGRDERRAALEGAFVPGGQVERVRGRRVLLIDDVVTTGSTLLAASSALEEAGSRGVLALVGASTSLRTKDGLTSVGGRSNLVE